MPNWCSNTLNVIGPQEAVKAFVNAARGPGATYNEFHGEPWEAFDDTRKKIVASNIPEPGNVQDLSFHALYPVPDDVRRFGYDSGQAAKIKTLMGYSEPLMAGYEWEGSNWGVKWGASDVNLTTERAIEAYGGNSLATYEFETPWGPPDALFEKVSEDFPELTFELQYSEPGMGFEGRMEWSSGERTSDESWEYEDEEEWDDE